MSTGSSSGFLSPSSSSAEPDEEEEYVVEDIRRWRFNVRDKRREYYIKWVGYGEKENTWEPEENLHCPDILAKFKSSLSPKQQELFNSDNPEDLTGFQRNATFQKCIGADGPHESDVEEESPKVERQRFYCLILFEDSDVAEEVTLKEFMQFRPKDAFKFCEQRMFKKC